MKPRWGAIVLVAWVLLAGAVLWRRSVGAARGRPAIEAEPGARPTAYAPPPKSALKPAGAAGGTSLAQREERRLRAEFASDPVLSRLDDEAIRKLCVIVARKQVEMGNLERSLAQITDLPSGAESVYIPPFPDQAHRLMQEFLSEAQANFGDQVALALSAQNAWMLARFSNAGQQDCVMQFEPVPVSGGPTTYRLTRAVESDAATSPQAQAGTYHDRDAVLLDLGHQMEPFLTLFPPAG